jgi:glycerol-3-phosphate dehydrogenase
VGASVRTDDGGNFDGTPCSLLPWGEHWLVGTTDTDDVGPLDEPSVTCEDVAYLIDQANRWLARPLTVEDVVGVYAGLRPLLSAGDADDPTATLSREHAVVAPAPGLVYVAGGKWTTYRVMAADVVDAAVEALLARRPERAPVPECTTDQIPVVGADDFGAAWADRERTRRQRPGPRHRRAPAAGTATARPPCSSSSRASPTWAGCCTGASYLGRRSCSPRRTRPRTLDDALTRRLRLTTEVRDAGSSVAADAAALMARVHGWDADEQRAAVESLAHSRRARVPTSVPAPRPTTVAPRRGLTARGLMARTRERMSGAGGHRE